jgi:hypothetical protein
MLFIPDPVFSHPRSWVPDPGSNNIKKEERKKNFLFGLFCSHTFHKLLSSQNYGFGIGIPDPDSRSGIRIRDPGSGFEIRDPEKLSDPDPGVKKAPDPGSGSAILLLKACFHVFTDRSDINTVKSNGVKRGNLCIVKNAKL